MKKFLIGAACGILVSLSSAAFAAEAIQALLFPVTFDVNGKAVDPGNEYSVLNYKNQAYVPIRLVVEQLDATIDYEAETGQIFIQNQALNVIDSEYPSVSVGNLILIKEGPNTKVTGQLRFTGSTNPENILSPFQKEIALFGK